MEETNTLISKLDTILDTVLDDYQIQLERIEKIKVILFNRWVEARELGENKEEISDRGLLDLMSEIKELPVVESKFDNLKNVNSNKANKLPAERKINENHFDCSEAPNSYSFKKDKSYLGQIKSYQDNKISNIFHPSKPYEKQDLKRKSILINIQIFNKIKAIIPTVKYLRIKNTKKRKI